MTEKLIYMCRLFLRTSFKLPWSKRYRTTPNREYITSGEETSLKVAMRTFHGHGSYYLLRKSLQSRTAAKNLLQIDDLSNTFVVGGALKSIIYR